MNRKFENQEERLSFIEFRQQLLFDNNDIDRLLFKYEITEDEYRKIMDLFDNMRAKIDKKENINHSKYEEEMYKILPQNSGDYHMCEFIAKGFMDSGRWDEIFPVLYGDMPKYSYLKTKDDK